MLSTMRSVAALTLALSALSVQTVSAIVAGPVTAAGCFNDSTGLQDNGVFNYQSKGHCQETCIGVDATVMAMTNANECWCGTSLPPKSSMQSDNSKCNKPCVGYPTDTCGGNGYWSVYFTTTDTDVDYSGGGGSSGAAASSASSSSAAATKSSSASSSTAGAASTITATSASAASDKATVITSIAPGKTVIITQAASQATNTAEPVDKSKKGGSNTAGIAAGVVVGIVVIAALIGAAFFFWRRKQRREAESGHQQLNDYSSASQKPMAFRPAPGPDSRIDPHAMASRRQSDGSIADNEDYSRRILKVTNA